MTGSAGILIAVAILASGIAVGMGPLRLTMRAMLRYCASAAAMRRWQWPVTMGVGAGLLASVVASGVFIGPNSAVLTATVGLLVLLAILDLAWRWLPFVWTLPLLTLAIVAAYFNGTAQDAAFGVLLGAGMLWSLQLCFRHWRGVEALGTGDIWLAAALGALVGPQQIALVLGIAAVTGLTVEVLQNLRSNPTKRRRLGVAYGAHMCLAYFVSFPL